MIAKLSVILFAALAVSATEDTFRPRRSLQPGAPNVYNRDEPWQLDPHIQRDDRGNVRTDVNIKHHGEGHDFDAGWSKVVRGPNKAKPTWHAGGTFRWRRSAEPEEDYLIDEEVNRNDEENGVTIREKRSAQEGEPWELTPNVGRGDDGNTRADINIKRHGDNHDFDAGWSKIIDGPGRAKPTWHVGGTFRWKRSAEPWENNLNDEEVSESGEEEGVAIREKRSAQGREPWELTPNVGRGDDGNTRADVNIKRHGDNHDFEAGWSKVIDGPGRAKPTWHVGGTFRWRRSAEPWENNLNDEEVSESGEEDEEEGVAIREKRSAQGREPWELTPNVGRGDDGNTRADVNIKRHGDNHDFEAGWSKVLDGPGRAKPTWHVGGTFRWRRSAEPEVNNLTEEEVSENDEEGVTIRKKRSAQGKEPWELTPNVGRGDDGNTRADINIKRHGDNHDFEAGWSKVIDGPGRAKPTWHAGGTFRWKRSVQPGAPSVNNKNQPWQLDPHIERDDRGNTKTDVNINHHGKNHDLDAGWSKVIRGPNKAKPTWHVGGTFRWRRSPQPEEIRVVNEEE